METQPAPVQVGGDEKRNLIVNYLPNTVTQQSFRNMFSPFGEIESSRVVYDKQTGISMGYGFVKFKAEEAAAMAITSLNGQQLETKTLKVSYAAKPGGVPSEQQPNIYVAHLDKNISQEDLQTMFEPYGKVVETKLLTDPTTGESRGAGFVRFETLEQAQLAIDVVNNFQPEGALQALVVRFSDNKGDKKRKRGIAGGYYNPVRFNQFATTLVPQRGMPMAVPGLGLYAPAASFSIPQAQTFNLFVYNIPSESDDAYLYRMFAPYGAIQSVKAVRDATTNTCKGYGFVHYSKLEDAQQAILALNGTEIEGKLLQVSFKTPKKV